MPHRSVIHPRTVWEMRAAHVLGLHEAEVFDVDHRGPGGDRLIDCPACGSPGQRVILTGKARLWEPRRLRLRLFTAAGQLVTTGRRRILRLARHWPFTGHITAALARLALLPNPG